MERNMTNAAEWTIANRGGVYEFYNNDGGFSGNVVVVVSSDDRAKDRFISILMPGNSPVGADVMPIIVDGTTKYLHCGMISYTSRERLGRKIEQLDADTMKHIERIMSKSLGISDEVDYKSLYENLVNKLVMVNKEKEE